MSNDLIPSEIYTAQGVDYLRVQKPDGVFLNLPLDPLQRAANADAKGMLRQIAASGYNTLPLTNPSGLKRWRQAYGDARFANAGILWIGPSTVFGSYSDNVSGATADLVAAVNSAAGQLPLLFAQRLGGNPGRFMHVREDKVTRTNSGGFAFVRGPNAIANDISSSGPGTFSFPLPACTTIEIISFENNGVDGSSTTGDYSYNIDGAGAVAVPTTGLANTWRVKRVTGLANTTHTVVLTGTTTNHAWIIGINAYGAAAIGSAGGGGVTVGRFGVPGWTLSDALGLGANCGPTQGIAAGAGGANARLGLLRAIAANNPALLIMEYGINEVVYQATASWASDIVSFEAQMRSVVAQQSAQGGCTLLLADGFTNAAISPAGPNVQTDYMDVMKKIALDTTNVSHARISDLLGTWAQANAAGMMNDNSHPTRAGYGCITRAVFELLDGILIPEIG